MRYFKCHFVHISFTPGKIYSTERVFHVDWAMIKNDYGNIQRCTIDSTYFEEVTNQVLRKKKLDEIF